MKMEDVIEAGKKVLSACYEDVRWHLYPRLLTEDEFGKLDKKYVTVRNSFHRFALMLDFQRICSQDSVILHVTNAMLKLWGKPLEKEVSRWAFGNAEREAGYGFGLVAHTSGDVCDGHLPMYEVRFRSELASRYAAASICSALMLRQTYEQLGAFNAYILGSGERDLILAKACDMEGINAGTPLWYQYSGPPRVSGPILRFDGTQLACCGYDMSAVPLKNHPGSKPMLLDSVLACM